MIRLEGAEAGKCILELPRESADECLQSDWTTFLSALLLAVCRWSRLAASTYRKLTSLPELRSDSPQRRQLDTFGREGDVGSYDLPQ